MYQMEICIALLGIIAIGAICCAVHARCYMNWLVYGEYQFRTPKK